jgi:hypothetical protein
MATADTTAVPINRPAAQRIIGSAYRLAEF